MTIEIEKGVDGHSIKESIAIVSNYAEFMTEGGAAGHMSHPFDDRELTFADLKEMIRRYTRG